MTEQSTLSIRQSETGGRAYSSQLLAANARLLQRRANAERSLPQPIGANTQKLSNCRSSTPDISSRIEGDTQQDGATGRSNVPVCGWTKTETGSLRRKAFDIRSTPDSLVVESGIPLRHRRLVIEDPPAQWAKERDRICGKIGSGFLLALIGTRGTGKTQIATEAVLHNAVTKRTSRYLRAMQAFLELRATFSSPDASELDVIERLREPSLLVIDEMQERGETNWEDRILNHVIDLRYGDMSDTILIANLEPDKLQESLGESISSRLLETGGVIECKWSSFRKVTK